MVLGYVRSKVSSPVASTHTFFSHLFHFSNTSSIGQTYSMSFALLRFSASAVIAATVMLSASRRTSAAAIHAERSLSGGPAQATWQNFETNPALTTGGKCAYQQITGAWANGGHNVAVGGFSYSDCGKCIKMTNTGEYSLMRTRINDDLSPPQRMANPATPLL